MCVWSFFFTIKNAKPFFPCGDQWYLETGERRNRGLSGSVTEWVFDDQKGALILLNRMYSNKQDVLIPNLDYKVVYGHNLKISGGFTSRKKAKKNYGHKRPLTNEQIEESLKKRNFVKNAGVGSKMGNKVKLQKLPQKSSTSS